MTKTAAPSSSVDRTRITDRIFTDLKEQILSGAFPKGGKLPTEKALARQYAASIPTVREAVRGLSLSGLIEVKHGNGAYVTASDQGLIGLSLGSVMRMQDIGVRDMMELLHVLIEHAALSAIANATEEDITALREAAERFQPGEDAARNGANARLFHHALVKAAHNPLLGALSGYFSTLQAEFMRDIVSMVPDLWMKEIAGVQTIRLTFVAAIEARNEKLAVTQARAFATQAMHALEVLQRAAIADARLPAMHDIFGRTITRMERR